MGFLICHSSYSLLSNKKGFVSFAISDGFSQKMCQIAWTNRDWTTIVGKGTGVLNEEMDVQYNTSIGEKYVKNQQQIFYYGMIIV